MLQRLRHCVSYANVVATLALFTALGGVSYAAMTLPAGGVGTRQLKNHAVTLIKISGGARAALQGHIGPQGDPGTARAYGEVAAGGALRITKGNPTVTHDGALHPGIPCITVPGIDPSITRASVTLGGGSVDANAAPPTVGAGGVGATDPCAVGSFEVLTGTFVNSGGTIGYNYTDEPFFFAVP